MLQKEILEKFKVMFPMYAADMTEWIPNGKGSIRVKLDVGELVFTYKNDKEWSLETKAIFLDRFCGRAR